ncbi:MAG: hypothetical protein IJY74_07390 [Oscillospiraceae bacterium]|nr:hypothetical protein [Oscillospiraceae bacterium]
MKRAFCILAAAVCMIGICSCGKNAENDSQEYDRKNAVITNENVLNAESTDQQDENTSETENIPEYTSSETAPAETEAVYEATETETAAMTETDDPAETEITAATVLEGYVEVQQTTRVVTEPYVETVETEPAEGIFGAEGRTKDEWLTLGQELHMEACELAFRYLCTGSEFPFDRANLEIIDRTYFLTIYTSFEEATAPYYELFSRSHHSNDFDGLLLEQDGRLYAARAARGMDVTYLSSEVSELVSVTNTEVRYRVTVEYEDSTETYDFTLVPEDGFWKIGEFTLPY